MSPITVRELIPFFELSNRMFAGSLRESDPAWKDLIEKHGENPFETMLKRLEKML